MSEKKLIILSIIAVIIVVVIVFVAISQTYTEFEHQLILPN
jgi:uncharacterized membrane protein YvbJ